MSELGKNIGEALFQNNVQIHVRNAGKFTFPVGYRFENHNHLEYEIIYINQGSFAIQIENNLITLKRGDCIVINPGVRHLIFVDSKEPCRATQLEFTAEVSSVLQESMIFFQSGTVYRTLSGCESTSVFMENICRIIRTEMEPDEKEVLINLAFIQLFIELSGKIKSEYSENSKHGKAGKIGEIIRYIKTNFDKNLNMEKIAEDFNVSSRYIRKCFQQEMGMSCQAYISSLRVNRAKELLWSTPKTVTEIAYESGFGSSQYFCRVFMSYTKMTPLEYRDLWKHQVAEEACVVDIE